MNKSESIKNLAAALCKAQAAMGGAIKGTENPFFKKNYSDMAAVVDALKIPFSDNGLSYSQFPVSNESTVGVETILMHSSGEWMSSTLLLPMLKADPQKAGSAITYARRYALQAIAGIPSEDDDGNAASQSGSNNAISGRGKTKSLKPDFSKEIKAYWAVPEGNKRQAHWLKLSQPVQQAIIDGS